MPTYCYRNESTNEVHEVNMSIFEKELDEKEIDGKKYININGELCARDFVSEKHGFKTFPENWPKTSWAISVHPDQVDEAERYAEQNLGVKTEYDRKTGGAIFKDRNHFKKFLKRANMHDRDAWC